MSYASSSQMWSLGQQQQNHLGIRYIIWPHPYPSESEKGVGVEGQQSVF